MCEAAAGVQGEGGVRDSKGKTRKRTYTTHLERVVERHQKAGGLALDEPQHGHVVNERHRLELDLLAHVSVVVVVVVGGGGGGVEHTQHTTHAHNTRNGITHGRGIGGR